MSTQLLSAATAAICVSLALPASAKLVGVDFRIPGNLPSHTASEGGPHWTGIVDTVADTLSIYSWEEQANSIDYWSPAPSNFAMVWPAVDGSGAPYDVPDSFDGTINGDFAFISELNVHEIVWNEESTESGGLLLPLVATFYPGWGGARFIPNGETELAYDTSWNEEYMPKLLITPNGLGIVAADDGIVSLVDISTISPVPEASTIAIWSLLSCLAAAATWLRSRSAATVSSL